MYRGMVFRVPECHSASRNTIPGYCKYHSGVHGMAIPECHSGLNGRRFESPFSTLFSNDYTARKLSRRQLHMKGIHARGKCG